MFSLRNKKNYFLNNSQYPSYIEQCRLCEDVFFSVLNLVHCVFRSGHHVAD